MTEKKNYKLSQFPKLWHDYFSKYKTTREKFLIYSMIILILAESTFLFIQAAKAYQSKSAEDLSLPAFIILITTNVAWILYGWYVLKDVPVIISGILYVTGAALVLTAVFSYK